MGKQLLLIKEKKPKRLKPIRNDPDDALFEPTDKPYSCYIRKPADWRRSYKKRPEFWRDDKYSLFLNGPDSGCGMGVDSLEEILKIFWRYKEEWDKRHSVKCTMDTLFFKSFTDEIQKGDLFGQLTLVRT